ncbi:MAG: hypothetical protein RDV41_04820 [Planctomycetota bacterium]|nr:hypothetical protein [Planctomycetota bacterium]
MRLLIGVLVIVVFVGLGCSSSGGGGGKAATWPEKWAECVGKPITLEGEAANAKLGALLISDESSVWIDGLDSWPTSVYSGVGKGPRLRVTGTVITRDDVPAFVQKPGEPISAGVPVESEKELESAKWRFLLKDAKWSAVEQQ